MATSKRPVPGCLLSVLITASLLSTGALAALLTPEVDLISTSGSYFRADTAVHGTPWSNLTQNLPATAFSFTDSYSHSSQSPGWPVWTSARAVASADIDVEAELDSVTGDVVFSGVLNVAANVESRPFCDEFGCDYPDDADAVSALSYRVTFDLLVPMYYWLRVEVEEGADFNPGPLFEFDSLVQGRNLTRIDGGVRGGTLIHEEVGWLVDGYHELVAQFEEYASVPDDEGELMATASGRIRYWLAVNPLQEATPVPAPGALVLLITALASIARSVRQRR